MPPNYARTVWFALGVWLVAGLVTLALFQFGPLPALLFGAAGGVAFGWVSARRVDSRRVKVRKRRKRRRREVADVGE